MDAAAPHKITSPPCVPIGFTWQEMGSLHSLEKTLHSLQHYIYIPIATVIRSGRLRWHGHVVRKRD